MYRLSHIHGAIVIHDDYEEEQAKVEFADDEPEKELNFDDSGGYSPRKLVLIIRATNAAPYAATSVSNIRILWG